MTSQLFRTQLLAAVLGAFLCAPAVFVKTHSHRPMGQSAGFRNRQANDVCNATPLGKVVLKLKTPWRDGTTHLVMSPLEFMQAPGGVGAPTTAASDPLPRRAGTQRQAAQVVPQESDEGAEAAQTRRTDFDSDRSGLPGSSRPVHDGEPEAVIAGNTGERALGYRNDKGLRLSTQPLEFLAPRPGLEPGTWC